MARERLSMRKIKELLRLTYGLGLSQRHVARACGMARSSVSEYLARAEQVGIRWPLPEGAARSGYPVLYTRAPRLFAMLHQARGDGSHLKTLTRLAKIHVLIIDDLLLSPLADLEQQDLMEIIEDRDNQGSTVISSQYPLVDWHFRIGDPTLADAICDRATEARDSWRFCGCFLASR